MKTITLSEEENHDDTDNNESDYMIPKQQILNLNHLVTNKSEQIDHIYKKTLLVTQIANEINQITHAQEDKINDIENNVVEVKENSKETLNNLIKSAKEDQKLKINHCYLILFLSLIILIMIFFI